MRRLAPLAALLLVLAASTVAAQQRECGNGLPCGSIPWTIGQPPQLQSPTPYPDVMGEYVPGTPVVTATPVGSDLGIDTISDDIATLGAYQPTPQSIISLNGTPVALDDEVDRLTQDAAMIFGYVRGLSDLNLGKLTPLMLFLTTAFTLVAFVKAWIVLFPVFAAVVGFFRRILSLIMDFLPL